MLSCFVSSHCNAMSSIVLSHCKDMRESLGAPRLIFHPFLGLRYLTHGIVSYHLILISRIVMFSLAKSHCLVMSHLGSSTVVRSLFREH